MMMGLSGALNALMDLQNAMERAMGNEIFGMSTTQRGSYPAINFFEKDNELLAVCEIPGINKEDLDIEIHKDLLRIRGKRNIDYGDEVSIHRMERFNGTIDRTVKIPYTVDRDKVNASYENGILTIHLPRHESERIRKIAIQ